MVVEISKINPVCMKYKRVAFCSNNNIPNDIVVTDLHSVTPDFKVKTPQQYSKLGEKKLNNGLVLYSYKLANGHRVSIIPMENSPTIVKNYVNVGSMNETDNIKGISHFLEHMAFNGTVGDDGYLKLNTGDVFKTIDKLGGWTNASTNYALTDYVNSTPMLNEKDLETQVEVISAITENLALTEDMIEKEKFTVSSEIDMILDSPETVAVDQTVRTLFNIKSSADELVGGSIKHIQNLTRQDVLDYYNKYYTPDNMHLVITGNVNPENVMEIVSKNFSSKKTPNNNRYEEPLIPIQKSVRKDIISDKTNSAVILMGFATPPQSNIKDFVMNEIFMSYMHSSEAGITTELDKINTSMINGVEKITTNSAAPTFSYMEMICTDENSEKVLKILFDKLSNLKIKDKQTLNHIKHNLLQSYNDTMEHSLAVNTFIGNSEFNKNLEYLTNYEEILESITIEDINNYIKRTFDCSKSAITIVHPNVSKEKIFNNYAEAGSLSFKGKKRVPLNSQKLSETTLDNNYKIAFSESNNENLPYYIMLKYSPKPHINPATYIVLNEIYNNGTANHSKEDFMKLQEDKETSINLELGANKIILSGYSGKINATDSIKLAKELISQPRITEESLADAINTIKTELKYLSKTSSSLLNEYEASLSPNIVSTKEIASGIDRVSLNDVIELHNYIMKNSVGVIAVNIPGNSPEIKNEIINEFSQFNPVQPFKLKKENTYVRNAKPVVIAKKKNTSQADISETFRFQYDRSLKNRATIKLMNLILSNSDTIGLFNNLREKEHLAYSVHSFFNAEDDLGQITLNILTSTDNKETGIKSYENVKKSINGFNTQINKLVNSEYTDEDLETAKKILKAKLLNKETAKSKIISVANSLIQNMPPDGENELFNIIDTITREDIDNLSKQIFSNPPVYTMVASEDTIINNKEFLQSLKY